MMNDRKIPATTYTLLLISKPSEFGAVKYWGTKVGTLRSVWPGHYTLAKVFWVVYVLGCIGALVAAALILVASSQLRVGTIGFILGVLIAVPYWLFASVGVWNSAKNSIRSPAWMDRVWGIAARGIVLIFVLRFIFNLANGGALNLMARMSAPMDF
jgi:hypothetical protein